MTTGDLAFRPNWVSAPGETIADILRERHISPDEFAKKMQLTETDVADLLHGRATVTIAIARRLEHALGGSVEFWMSRDYQYRQDSSRLHVDEGGWLRELPVGDMIKFGWLDPIPHPREEVRACLRFFGLPSVAAWRDAYVGLQHMAAFRTSHAFDTKPGSLAAWLRRGEIEAEGIKCAPWNSDQFGHSLSELRGLTRRRDPNLFIPELQERCAASGVAVVIIRAPSGCRASGAVRFVSPTKALIQLSFRFLSDDQFWFTFFHEAGHLLIHPERISVVEALRGDRLGIVEGADTLSEVEEEEANSFSADVLIPAESRVALSGLAANQLAVIRFAVRAGVSPGIVVGQLQHLDRLGHDQFNNLKRRYRWTE